MSSEPRFGRKLKNPTLTRKEGLVLALQHKQEETRSWIERVLNEKLAPGADMHQALGDGTVLCRLLNVLFPGVITRINPADSLPFKLRENIVRFLQVVEKMGVPEAARFQVDDLFEAKNLKLVYTTLEYIADMAEHRGLKIKWYMEEPAPIVLPNKPTPTAAVVMKAEDPVEIKLRRVSEEAAATQQYTAMHVAAQSKETVDVMQLLIKKATAAGKLKELLNAQESGELGNTPLHVAVEQECMEAAELLIGAGADVNARNKKGDTPLHCAVVRGKGEMVDLLVAAKAEMNGTDNHGNTPLHAAINEGGQNDENAIKLINKGANVAVVNDEGNTPLHLAAREGMKEVAELILSSEAGRQCKVQTNAHGDTPLLLAAEKADIGLIQLLADKKAVNLANKEGTTAVHMATLRGNKAAIKLLLQAGGDVNAKNATGETALIIATQKDNADMVEFLTNAGAEIDAKRSDGWSALYAAAYNGNDQTVNLLLKKGANANLQNSEGWTPMHAAAAKGHLSVIKILAADYHAPFNTQSKQGTTPLYHAVAGNHMECARYLILIGADVNLGASEGWRPIHIACYNDLHDMVRLLCTNKVDVNATNKVIKGYAPLHIIVSLSVFRKDMLITLLTNGANINAENEHGQTPLHLAVFWNKPEVVDVLLQYNPALTTKNSKGRTPLDLACHFGFESIAVTLAKRMGVPCPPIKKTFSPLSISVGVPEAPPKPDDFAASPVVPKRH